MLRIGTRRSALALRQADLVAAALRAALPGQGVELVPLVTAGDRAQEQDPALVGGKGVFVQEIEDALLRGEIDLAVHSAKDVPAALPAGLSIVAFPCRADPRDVMVGAGLGALDPGAAVGTSSLRRAVQLRALRPDLAVVPLRGNVDTRLRRVAEGRCAAAVLAAAGLVRLGRQDAIAERLDPDVFLPAAGQGALAVEGREGDGATAAAAAALDHPATRAAVEAERGFLERLGGGCLAPAGALGRLEGGCLVLDGMVAGPRSGQVVRCRAEGAAEGATELGRSLAERVLAAGGAACLAEVAPR